MDFPEGLPTGTVTFLFTDIEGSTRLLKQLREGYGELLADHQQILRDSFEAHGGREVDTQREEAYGFPMKATSKSLLWYLPVDFKRLWLRVPPDTFSSVSRLVISRRAAITEGSSKGSLIQLSAFRSENGGRRAFGRIARPSRRR